MSPFPNWPFFSFAPAGLISKAAGFFLVLSAVIWLALPRSALAQEDGSGQAPLPPDGRETLHLTTIGTYSAGFVLQSYGYIGVLADVLSQGVYEAEMVRSMLGETITFLRNAREQLTAYLGGSIQIAAGDMKFIRGISDIIMNLIEEAEALSSFAQSRDKADLERFEDSRKKAWSGIKTTLGVS